MKFTASGLLAFIVGIQLSAEDLKIYYNFFFLNSDANV